LAPDFPVDAASTPDAMSGVVKMTTKATNAIIAPVIKTEANATTSAAPVEAGTKPLDGASLESHFAAFAYPAPHRFALLFPRLTASAQAMLTESIRLNRMRERVTIFNGQIADGVSRCLSAIELGLRWEELRKDEFEGDEAALLQFVIDKNLSRRQLDESQRAMVAARMANMRQGARTDLAQICAMSQQAAAYRMNVGRRLVQDAVKVTQGRCAGPAGGGGQRHLDGDGRGQGTQPGAEQAARDGGSVAHEAQACQGVYESRPR
jgi:hypothetical protein